MKLDYDLNRLDFDRDWLEHRGIHEWWYVTGFAHDRAQNLYSYQYTVTKAKLPLVQPRLLMLAVTDFKNGRHYYHQNYSLTASKVKITENSVEYLDSKLLKTKNGFTLSCQAEDFAFDLALTLAKGPVWHGEQGRLRMGSDDPQDTTFYYSYTHLPTSGELKLNGKIIPVQGSSWLDRQGGPFHILQGHTHWEWFSLRFFDQEEIMLFAYPQAPTFNDGTLIDREGRARRLLNYELKTEEMIEVRGIPFSKRWTLTIPGYRCEHFTLRPLMDGQMNLAYFEELCEICDPAGHILGYCFAELLPGVHGGKPSLFGFFKKQ